MKEDLQQIRQELFELMDLETQLEVLGRRLERLDHRPLTLEDEIRIVNYRESVQSFEDFKASLGW